MKKMNNENLDNREKELPKQKQVVIEELRLLVHNLLKVQEDERKRYSNELNDELGQRLTAIYAEAESLSNYEKIETFVSERVQSIKSYVNNMHEIIHNLTHELRPVLFDTVGLSESLNDLIEEWRIYHPDVLFNITLKGNLSNIDEILGITIYRIIQEALNNISIYAEATLVQIYLKQNIDVLTGNKMVVLSIEDNGRGFNQKQQSGWSGVLVMRERVNALGGKFSLYSLPNHGTHINIKFPI